MSRSPEHARAVLRGEQAWQPQALRPPPPQRLPANERRRAGTTIRLVFAAAEDALADSGLDPAEAQLRAEIIAAMIEGFTVQAPASSQLAQRLEPLRELTVKTALQVARGDTIEAGPP